MSAALRLKPNQDKRLRAGHLWVYSNEIDTKETPLKGLTPGQPVVIENAQGKFVAHAYANPNSLICARLVSRDPKHELTQSLIVHRLKIALSLRERFTPEPFYRWVFGEADGLPGLVIDRFGDHVVAQLTTAGMELMKADVIDAIVKVISPSSILFKNDSSIRELEGIERYIEVGMGEVPDRVQLREAGVTFEVALAEGQKTGWFYDQAFNRNLLMPHVDGKRVLDVCSYVGGWGVRAAVSGASEAVCVDVSAHALEQVEVNAKLNNVADHVMTHRGDAFETLRQMKQAGEQFDVIVVDPPAFIKRKKDLKEGALAYRRLNEAAISLLSKDGLLVSASCSFHMDRDHLLSTIQQAGRHSDRHLQLLMTGQQSPDHPIHPAIPETAYLKAFYLRVLPTM